nr:hypothetical protein [Tanacetum cinerariifolium]
MPISWLLRPIQGIVAKEVLHLDIRNNSSASGITSSQHSSAFAVSAHVANTSIKKHSLSVIKFSSPYSSVISKHSAATHLSMPGFTGPCPHAIPPPDTNARTSSASPISKQQKQYIATVAQVLEFTPNVKVQAIPPGTDLYLNKLAPSVGPNIFLPKKQMAGPIEGGGPEGSDDREETPPPLTKEQIEGHVSALKSLIKSHNRKNKGDPIRLDFEMVEIEIQGHTVVKGKEVMDEDPRKPFKEGRRTPFTRRIIEFAGPEYKMPNNIKLYDGTTD